jgi:hypothetical protein
VFRQSKSDAVLDVVYVVASINNAETALQSPLHQVLKPNLDPNADFHGCSQVRWAGVDVAETAGFRDAASRLLKLACHVHRRVKCIADATTVSVADDTDVVFFVDSDEVALAEEDAAAIRPVEVLICGNQEMIGLCPNRVPSLKDLSIIPSKTA